MTMGPVGYWSLTRSNFSLATRSATVHIAEQVKNNCFKSDPDKKSTTATKLSPGNKFSGEDPNVQNLFLSAISLGTNLVSHRNLLQTKSYFTHGVLISKHLAQILVIRGSPIPIVPFPQIFLSPMLFRNISTSEKSVFLRHSRHPALFHSAVSVHSKSSAPQFSSHATMPQIPHERMRPMPASFSMHFSHTRSCRIVCVYVCVCMEGEVGVRYVRYVM
mmetsp:Transcript_15502/g.28033  ORF Transcript_15502/g.28033 Transcript_15502/m.28033 type:complete len:218 (+) Transcript_15502:282-935(+)